MARCGGRGACGRRTNACDGSPRTLRALRARSRRPRITPPCARWNTVSSAAAPNPTIRFSPPRVWGLKFTNPVGLAAGFDKDARVVDAMLASRIWLCRSRHRHAASRKQAIRSRGSSASMRIAPSSIGSASTAAASRPSRERLIKRAASSRMRAALSAPMSARTATPWTAPPTTSPESKQLSGLCGLSRRQYLLAQHAGLARAPGARADRGFAPPRASRPQARRCPDPEKPPLLAKVGPDLSDAINCATSPRSRSRPGSTDSSSATPRSTAPSSLKSRDKAEAGGLSGAPLLSAVHRCLAALYRLTKGRLPLIGCGGVASGADAYAKIRAGASLVQVYSALVFEGPSLVERIKREIGGILARRRLCSRLGCGRPRPLIDCVLA